MFSFADFCFTKGTEKKTLSFGITHFSRLAMLLLKQFAKIEVDLLFCNANSNDNLIATGYHTSTFRSASVGNCSTHRPAGCQMFLDVLTLVLMTSCLEDDFVQLGLSLLSLTV